MADGNWMRGEGVLYRLIIPQSLLPRGGDSAGKFYSASKNENKDLFG